VVVIAAGLVVGAGTAFSRCDEASKTPCERYAATMARELDNCHSGVTRNHRHHIEICERSVSATEACLEKIETLSCPELEANPAAAAGDVCQK
jgi:hypothetical protein